jgi:hypothetical protein
MFALFSNQSENVQLSLSSGAFVLAATTETDITNLSVTITVSGSKYVWVGLISDGSGNESYLATYNQQVPNSTIRFYRGATNFDSIVFRGTGGSGGGSNTEIYRPSSAFRTLDRPTQGTYTYKVTGSNSGSTNLAVYYSKLIALELNF